MADRIAEIRARNGRGTWRYTDVPTLINALDTAIADMITVQDILTIYENMYRDRGPDTIGGLLARVKRLDAAENEIARLRKALARLGSSEALTYPHAIPTTASGNELRARIDYARVALGGKDDENPS